MALFPLRHECFVERLVGSSHSKMWPITNTTTTNNNQDSSDSDDDVLQAVLDFVESFDGHEHHHSIPIKSATHQPSPTRKRHSSERVRSEIEALRALAVQLEDRLAHLQFKQAASANAARRTRPSGWEIEALRQEEQRLQSEVENLQLKAVVEAQAKVAQRLEVLFERCVRHETQGNAIVEAQSSTSRLGSHSGGHGSSTATTLITEPPSPSHQHAPATQAVDDVNTPHL